MCDKRSFAEGDLTPVCVNEQTGRSSESGQIGGATASEALLIEELLSSYWKEIRGVPMSAMELLGKAEKKLEYLFHQSPIGPIPEYLLTHLWSYGCVSEYEDRLEELDRWKASALNRWLKERVGRRWSVAGKLYDLQEKKDIGDAEKFVFRLVRDTGSMC